ncbi:riboflavin synthase alpha chain [Andreprevotia lacus DSM 23236]|jgi:riboflavin synthase|uniref:Riboflavin synthase n=1 Tax=Andreprevotia lacus DSM 23236 TaxID=1121001 RepID=A0A1W1XNN0_9NEIS|nr:riboflavin synthase [Andreprevotia lacus]SMC25477.1 riboflavin synthase alpha chain [Andreprevotia lacus DSM 23236]
MFTGIVETVATIEHVEPFAGGVRLTVHAPGLDFTDVGLGDSITHNGACMTVTSLLPDNRFTIDVSDESLRCTVGLDRAGNRVNLEKALRVNARLGGHLVSGHVDGIGDVVSFDPVGDNRELVVRAPQALAKYLAVKGSVVVNGVSLTTNFVRDVDGGCEFSINLIPHTLQVTTLGGLAAGSKVNLEIDLIARYVERMLSLEARP